MSFVGLGGATVACGWGCGWDDAAGGPASTPPGVGAVGEAAFGGALSGGGGGMAAGATDNPAWASHLPISRGIAPWLSGKPAVAGRSNGDASVRGAAGADFARVLTSRLSPRW